MLYRSSAAFSICSGAGACCCVSATQLPASAMKIPAERIAAALSIALLYRRSIGRPFLVLGAPGFNESERSHRRHSLRAKRLSSESFVERGHVSRVHLHGIAEAS